MQESQGQNEETHDPGLSETPTGVPPAAGEDEEQGLDAGEGQEPEADDPDAKAGGSDEEHQGPAPA